MDELAAAEWLEQNVSRETRDKVGAFAELLLGETRRQNLISAESAANLYSRHIVDSLQLVRFSPDTTSWLDLGSGAGLPGILLALRSDKPVHLVESRRLRSDWLVRACDALALSHATVHAIRLERVPGFIAGTITARAFAPLATIFALAHRFADESTVWVLPKGASAAEELALAQRSWHGRFTMEPSITNPESSIIVATGVSPRYPGLTR